MDPSSTPGAAGPAPAPAVDAAAPLPLDAQASIATQIRRALSGMGLHAEFQPIFNLEDGEVLGLEALARFTLKPLRGPAGWFEDARALGLGLALETAAVREALVGLDHVPPDGFLSVNASPETVASAEFLELLGRRPERIVVEVRQQAATDDVRLVRALAGIRALGASLAIDDIGGEEKALSQALALQPEFIKLDIALCRNIHVDPVRRTAAERLVAIAQTAPATVIAEGIQARGELDVIRQLGVRFGQGYLMAVPGRLPLGDLTSVVERLTAPRR